MKCIYLVQSDKDDHSYEIPNGCDSLLLHWGKDHTPREDKFHFPGSTWMSGRNELFRRALLKGDYEYFIFLDDDIAFSQDSHLRKRRWTILNCINAVQNLQFDRLITELKNLRQDPFRTESEWFIEYEASLRRHRPAVATCPAVWHFWDTGRSAEEIETVSFGDHICIAFHKSVAYDLLPYTCNRETRANWWKASEEMHRKAFALCPNSVVRFNRHLLVNAASKDYPKDQTQYKMPVNTVDKAEPKHVSQLRERHEPRDPSHELGWNQIAIVLTSINAPTTAVQLLDVGGGTTGASIMVVGDRKSPTTFELKNGQFLSLEEQLSSPFRLAQLLPENHYCRKNLGYLTVIQQGKFAILDIDDDNIPMASFWRQRYTHTLARVPSRKGWVNSYRFFSHDRIWPRGVPLEESVNDDVSTEPDALYVEACIQQGLAQGDPDVDAVHRLTNDGDFYFREDTPLHLNPNQWSPINSQNTLWIGRSIASLLYLPSTCRFRETDILRGFVAQRILWTMGKGIVFGHGDVLQERNEHDLIADLDQESRLYQKVDKIKVALEALELERGVEHISENLRSCYQVLVDLGMVEQREMDLVEAWIYDLSFIDKQGLHA